MNIDVFGSFGFGNLGDEIIPTCVKNLFSSLGQSVITRAFSRYDGLTTSNVLEYNEYLNSNLTRTLLLCGGGIVENHEMSCLRRAMSKRDQENFEILPFAISVEPGVRFGVKARLKLIKDMSKFRKVYVRDVLSSQTLKSLAPWVDQDVIGDLGLWCEGSSSELNLDNLPSEYFTFIPSDNWRDDSFISWISEELIYISECLSLPIVLLPMSFLVGDDLKICRRIYDAVKSKNKKIEIFNFGTINSYRGITGEDIAKVVSHAAITISMRLHGCVISYAQRTPFLSLVYHPKLLGFMQTIGWDYAKIPENLPLKQTTNVYGYRFEALGLSRGDLMRTIPHVLMNQNYDMLEIYRSKQKHAIKKLFSL